MSRYASNNNDNGFDKVFQRRHLILPVLAGLILLVGAFADGGGIEEIEPGEVAVLYNTTGIPIFGDNARVIREQGTITYVPWFQQIETLDTSPQILVMAGGEEKEKDNDPNHARRLTVRANDGSNFWFDKLEIHYQMDPSKADKVIVSHGLGDAYKQVPVKSIAREVLRNEFGRYTFLEAANPGNYAKATTLAKAVLNKRLNPYGIEITQIITPKPSFDDQVELAIKQRQTAEQAVQVYAKQRESLVQHRDRLLQDVKEKKNAELQTHLANLAAQLQQAQNKLIDVKRDADKYSIDRKADGNGQNIAAVTKAKAQEDASRERAQGLAAKINAVGAQGPDVLNLAIAQKVFPQIKQIRATPFYRSSTPLDIRTTALPALAGRD